MKDNTKYEWREFAGSGELIKLTLQNTLSSLYMMQTLPVMPKSR